MAGINQGAPGYPVQEQQLYPPPGPAYSPGPGAPSQAAPPPVYMQGSGGQYASTGAPMAGASMGYPSEQEGKRGMGGPGPSVVYQPVATGQPQVVVYTGAGGPELPVSPHPAIALGNCSRYSTD